MRQVNAEIRYMKAFKPDAVVSDSRLSSIFAAKLLGLPVLLILNQFTPLIPRAEGHVHALEGRGRRDNDPHREGLGLRG